MISAKRNKEGVVEISGLIDNRQYFISVDGNVLYVSDVEGCKIVKIEDEKETEPKFIPTHEELYSYGFMLYPEKFANGFMLYPEKFANRIAEDCYYEKEDFRFYFIRNQLFFKDLYSIPFHTKQDFMRIVGVKEKHDRSCNGGIEYYANNIKKFNESFPNVSDFKITYVPSEKTLQDLKFYSVFGNKNWYEKVLEYGKKITIQTDKGILDYDNVLDFFLHSDSELKMLVEILGREK